jgi:16S rRNA (cytidine1402-2'-O)-methyltransferase
MSATLFVVATPLGNLSDASAHLVECLRSVHAIYAEDTRRSRILLDHFSISKALRSLHAHNEGGRIREVLSHLGAGESVALLCDAGTPAVSDPGSELVAAVHAAGGRVSPVAGPSALTAALSVAGFTGAGVSALFLGFLPTRKGELSARIDDIAAHRGVVVFFEAPNRLTTTLEALASAFPEREVCVCRELTKLYEEVVRGPAQVLVEWARAKEILGEITVVVGPRRDPPPTADEAALTGAIARCLTAGLSARDTATAVSAVLQVPRRQAYARCLELAKA